MNHNIVCSIANVTSMDHSCYIYMHARVLFKYQQQSLLYLCILYYNITKAKTVIFESDNMKQNIN